MLKANQSENVSHMLCNIVFCIYPGRYILLIDNAIWKKLCTENNYVCWVLKTREGAQRQWVCNWPSDRCGSFERSYVRFIYCAASCNLLVKFIQERWLWWFFWKLTSGLWEIINKTSCFFSWNRWIFLKCSRTLSSVWGHA